MAVLDNPWHTSFLHVNLSFEFSEGQVWTDNSVEVGPGIVIRFFGKSIFKYIL